MRLPHLYRRRRRGKRRSFARWAKAEIEAAEAAAAAAAEEEEGGGGGGGGAQGDRAIGFVGGGERSGGRDEAGCGEGCVKMGMGRNASGLLDGLYKGICARCRPTNNANNYCRSHTCIVKRVYNVKYQAAKM